MFTDQFSYITPYYPDEAKDDMRKWKQAGKIAFYKVVPVKLGARCRNCQDMGAVLVSFAKAGPFKHPPGVAKGEVMTWFDGDGQVGRGWFIVKKTVSYVCPNCAGRPFELPLPEPEAKEEWWQTA